MLAPVRPREPVHNPRSEIRKRALVRTSQTRERTPTAQPPTPRASPHHSRYCESNADTSTRNTNDEEWCTTNQTKRHQSLWNATETFAMEATEQKSNSKQCNTNIKEAKHTHQMVAKSTNDNVAKAENQNAVLPLEIKSANPPAMQTPCLGKSSLFALHSSPNAYHLIQNFAGLTPANRIYTAEYNQTSNLGKLKQSPKCTSVEKYDSKRENVAPPPRLQPPHQCTSARMYVDSYTKYDVLANRGNRSLKNEGNQWYLEERNKLQPRYVAVERMGEKSVIAQELINRVHSRGGRFLRFDKDEGRWYELDEQATRNKVSQALREKPTLKPRADYFAFGQMPPKTNDERNPAMEDEAKTRNALEAKANEVLDMDVCASAKVELEMVRDGDASELAPIKQNTPLQALSHQHNSMQNAPTPPITLSAPTWPTPMAHSSRPEISYVDSYTDCDVLADRGNYSSRNKGNKWYLEERNRLQARYLAAERIGEKGAIARELIASVRSRGGRFLRFDKKVGLWYELDEVATQKKVSQALREKLTSKDTGEKSAAGHVLQKMTDTSIPVAVNKAKSNHATGAEKRSYQISPKDLDIYVSNGIQALLAASQSGLKPQAIPFPPAATLSSDTRPPEPRLAGPRPDGVCVDSGAGRDALADQGNLFADDKEKTSDAVDVDKGSYHSTPGDLAPSNGILALLDASKAGAKPNEVPPPFQPETSPSALELTCPRPDVTYFDSYNDHDVLADRGNHSSKNKGNRWYLEERNRLQARYLAAERIGEKSAIAQELIASVRAHGGRFLRFDRKMCRWYELDEQATRRKVCQAFREKLTAKAREDNRRKYAVIKQEPTTTECL